MDIWNGSLRLDEKNEIRDIQISAPLTKLLLPNDCTLQFLSHVDTTRIPLQLICGSRLDISTADPDTETWFSNRLLSSNDAEERGSEWWQNATLESPLGILAAVQVTEPSKVPRPRTTEIIFYAARKDAQHNPLTPPHNEAPCPNAEFGLYALALSSDLLLSNEVEVTPPSSPILGATDTSTSTSTPTGRFIPHPWDGPSLRQKRKIAIDSTFSAAEDHRRNLKRNLGTSVAAAASNTQSLPSLPRLKSEASRGAVPLLTRPQSRSPSIPSLRRENTATAAESRRVSGLCRETPVPVSTTTQTTEEQVLEKKNKDMISKVVLTGLRVWGFTNTSSKRKKRPSTSTTADTQPPPPPSDPAEEARDEEYKLLYHHVYKSTCFAFRVAITKLDFAANDFSDRVRDTVDSLLVIFCKDSSEQTGNENVDMGEADFKGAVVRTPKGELGEHERGLR